MMSWLSIKGCYRYVTTLCVVWARSTICAFAPASAPATTAHRLRMLVVMEVPGKRSPQASTTLEELTSSTCAVVNLGCNGVQGADVVRATKHMPAGGHGMRHLAVSQLLGQWSSPAV